MKNQIKKSTQMTMLTALLCTLLLIASSGALGVFGKDRRKKTAIWGGLAGVVLGALGLLTQIGGVVGKIPWLAVGIPAITGFYFDWFGGCIQAFIFCTLTAIFIKQAAEG